MIINNKTKDIIEKAAKKAKLDISKYSMSQLIMGYGVEKEHGSKMGKDTNITKDDPVLTLKIVIAHLKEDPKYYTKLKKAEL